MAPAGHALTHSGSPLQRKHFVAFVVAPSTGPSSEVIAHGQAFPQMPHPRHLSALTTLALTGGTTSMAPFGQASWQGTGCGHWWQVSATMRWLPQVPSCRWNPVTVFSGPRL